MNTEIFNKADITYQLDQFKDHLLTRLLEIENQLKGNQCSLKNENENKLNEFNAKIEKFNSRIDQMENFTNINKVRLENIDDLLVFQRETSDKLITHGVKLNGVQKDIKEACSKYDKIYLENLFIPGIIGEFCKFKNNREFVEFNLNNVQSLINFKEKCTGELKSSNLKVETMSKSISGQLESLEKGVKSYSQMLVESNEKNFKNEFSGITQKLQEIKMDNHRYAQDLKNAANELKTEKDKLTNIRYEIYGQLDLATNSFKEINKQTNENFDKIKEEYETIKRKFTEIAEFVKDVRFRRNLGVEVNKKDLKKIANTITFDSKTTSHQFHSVDRNNQNSELKNTNNKLGKNEFPQENDPDFSDDNSVTIKDEVESYVKKYITGNAQIVNSKHHKKETKKLNKSIPHQDSKIIKETHEENDNNITIERLNQNKVNKEDNKKKLNNLNINTAHIETSNYSAKQKLAKITTKIDLDTDKENKESLNFPESVESVNIGNTAGNSINENKSIGSKKKGFKEKFPSKLNLSEKDKEKEKDEKIELNHKRKQSSDLTPIANFSGQILKANTQITPNNNNNNIINNSLKRDSQSLQIFYDKFSTLKKDVFKRFAISEKRIIEIENSYKLAFDQLINQIKNFIPINLALNQFISKSKGNKIDSNDNYAIYNAASQNTNYHSNPYRETQNIVNNNTVSVNILDPTIIFKNSEFDSNNNKKRTVTNLGTLKNNLKRIHEIIPKEAINSNPSREEVTITKIRAKSSFGKKGDKEKDIYQ